ncbi:MAG: hypothetical protein JSV08_05865 [Acidobacteriota bacterium]|nr:MAG: hypothetical protein JSV08_05865 [Acidobacteriota bacterium]
MTRGRRRRGAMRAVPLLVPLVLEISSVSFGIELWSNEETRNSLSLDASLKCTGLASRAPDDPIFSPERESRIGLLRFRLGLGARFAESANIMFAYEQRLRVSSRYAGAGMGAGVLPAEAKVPFRSRQLDWQIDASSDDTYTYRHEIDRAFLALHPSWGEFSIGRQAIGLGRGVLFSAVDVFSPFSPLEVDREWRRGVDAVRLEYRASGTASAEIIGAFGEHWDESALLGRVRGIFGNVDGELLFGKRARDRMYAGTLSAAVGDAEAHLELAVFDVPERHPDGGPFCDDRLVGKTVLGGSYTFGVGDGLTLLAEYHYSGFGSEDVEDASARLVMDPVFMKRYLRGDFQIFSQHAAALRASYMVSSTWTASLLVIGSPEDGSGVASPSLTWDVAENVSFVASAFVPWGAEPSGGRIESEYGGAPLSLFLQISVYF